MVVFLFSSILNLQLSILTVDEWGRYRYYTTQKLGTYFARETFYHERGIYLEERTKALLVGVNLNNDPEFETALKELESLAEACDMEVVGVETQNVSQINTGVYVGTGRVEEIKAVVHMLEADVVIFDNMLSPMQLRNLKDIIERPVFDRTHLILQIFSSRARTREAQIQVETARLQYELPRLTGMGEILSRQGGGSGGLSNKGAGEKKLELDKRKIRHRISELKKELREVEKNRETQRKRRLVQGIPQVALVGYTNAGKSTLLSAVSSARPKIANYPFTTLEPSLGIVDYRDHQSFVMADIPGIIEGASEGKGLGLRFLRHIERNSLLLFMVPGDTDDIKKEYEVLLGELENFNPEMLDKHRVLAITKCDLLDEELIEMLKETLPTDLPVVFISSVTGQGIQELKDVLWKELNSESNKLQEITAEDTLVHRDKDMSRFQQELAAEGEDVVEYIDEDEIEDVDDLDDFEYE